MPDCVDIATAVAEQLNAGDFSAEFTAERLLMPDFELSELSELKVSVVPRALEFSPFSRQHTQYEYSVDIGIQKKIDTDIETELPALLALVEEIVTYLRKRKLALVPEAAWLKTVNDPVYSREHLSYQRTFTSVVTITYRTVK